MSYRITHGEKLFETNETRKLVHLRWVPFPNKHDGEGYARIMTLPDGSPRPHAAEIFSAWVLMVQVASKCKTRWVLEKDDGSPIDSATLAYKTKGRREWFDLAFPLLLEIGWISGDSPGVPADGGRLAGANRMEGKGIEGKGITIPAAAAFFERIINLNYQGPQLDGMLSDFRSMPRLSNYDPAQEGVPEAMLYVLESIPSITKRYTKFKIYAFLQKAVNENFPILALAGAMKAIIDLQHPPQDMAPYWQALIRKPDVLRKCWENEIWPAVKHGRYKLQ